MEPVLERPPDLGGLPASRQKSSPPLRGPRWRISATSDDATWAFPKMPRSPGCSHADADRTGLMRMYWSFDRDPASSKMLGGDSDRSRC